MSSKCRHNWKKVTRVPIGGFWGRTPVVDVYHCKHCPKKKRVGPFFGLGTNTGKSVRIIWYLRSDDTCYRTVHEFRQRV